MARQAGPLVHLQLSSLAQQADCVNWIWAIVKMGVMVYRMLGSPIDKPSGMCYKMIAAEIFTIAFSTFWDFI